MFITCPLLPGTQQTHIRDWKKWGKRERKGLFSGLLLLMNAASFFSLIGNKTKKCVGPEIGLATSISSFHLEEPTPPLGGAESSFTPPPLFATTVY